MTKVTEAVRTFVPFVPLIVNGYVPATVVPVVRTVSVDVPEVVTEVGANVGVAPVGSPVTLIVTAPVKPPEGVTVAVYVVDAPCTIEREAGVAVTVKSAVETAFTTRVTVVLWLKVPLVPVIVTT
jgi:hypothetical protein